MQTLNSPVPDTRTSLILRLADGQDREAWDEFVTIYSPLIYRLARSKSFQDADALELVQEVLLAVSKAVERWDADTSKGRFRDWLFRIACNLMINFLTRKKYQPIGNQEEPMSQLLHEPCRQSTQESAYFDLEYRREVFHWAASTGLQIESEAKSYLKHGKRFTAAVLKGSRLPMSVANLA